MQEPSKFYTVKQAASVLGISISTLRNWDRLGKVKAYRHPVNQYRLYSPAELDVLHRSISGRETDSSNGRAEPGQSSVGNGYAKNDEGPIVLIEDDPRDIQLILHAFQQNSLSQEVVVLRDGESALNYFFIKNRSRSPKSKNERHKARLIILDLKLPKIDGLEVLKRIKNDPLTRGVPVVVMSSSDDSQEVERSYQEGSNAYVVKSVDYKKFAKDLVNAAQFWAETNHLPKVAGQRENAKLVYGK